MYKMFLMSRRNAAVGRHARVRLGRCNFQPCQRVPCDGAHSMKDTTMKLSFPAIHLPAITVSATKVALLATSIYFGLVATQRAATVDQYTAGPSFGSAGFYGEYFVTP